MTMAVKETEEFARKFVGGIEKVIENAFPGRVLKQKDGDTTIIRGISEETGGEIPLASVSANRKYAVIQVYTEQSQYNLYEIITNWLNSNNIVYSRPVVVWPISGVLPVSGFRWPYIEFIIPFDQKGAKELKGQKRG